MAKILIADDAKVMRFHIAKLIKELGHTVTAEAKNGYETIEAYKKEKPDYVTLDVEMPTYNNIGGGIHTLKKLLEVDKNAVVIMISSQTGDEQITEALKEGATNYIRKPITSEKLKDMIDYLSKK